MMHTIRAVFAQFKEHFALIHEPDAHFSHHLTLLGILAVLLGSLGTYHAFIKIPDSFPVNSVISIHEGSTLSEVADQFHKLGVVRSDTLLQVFVMALKDRGTVIAGDYFFKQPRSIIGVADAITKGEYGLLPQSVTVPEGMSSYEMAKLFADKFINITEADFIATAVAHEGYLFPDTYLFLPNVRSEQIVETMTGNFSVKLKELSEEINASERELHDIVIMASLLEKEARRTKTRQMISGILWKRLSINMPLQVDATFLYINGKNTYELTLDDLADDSLYNTYQHKGLPVGPIANPGINSLYAALVPIENEYLFYLADREGNTYYSPTFEEHKQYKRMYVY